MGTAIASFDAGGSEAERRSTGRADLDGLMEMLDRLFVENFRLRGKFREAKKTTSSSSSAAPVGRTLDFDNASAPKDAPTPTATVDLTRFVVDSENGALSDDDDDEPISNRGYIPPPAAPPPRAPNLPPATSTTASTKPPAAAA